MFTQYNRCGIATGRDVSRIHKADASSLLQIRRSPRISPTALYGSKSDDLVAAWSGTGVTMQRGLWAAENCWLRLRVCPESPAKHNLLVARAAPEHSISRVRGLSGQTLRPALRANHAVQPPAVVDNNN